MTDFKQMLDKFDGKKSYHLWRLKLKAALIPLDLWEVVENPQVPQVVDPAVQAQVVAKVTYIKRMDKALSHIFLALEDSKLQRVARAMTPKQAIDILDAQYVNRAAANKLFLRRRLFTFRMAEKSSISDHIQALEFLSLELEAIGINVPDDDKALALLLSLPPSYEYLITALKCMTT